MTHKRAPVLALKLAAGALVFLGITAVDPADAGTVKSGIASFMDPSYGSAYLALPEGPGVTVTICAKRCIIRTSNDAGPDLAMQRAGRVADLSFSDFRTICKCDPWVVGLTKVTVEYGGGARATIPPTDAEGTDEHGSRTRSTLARAGQPLLAT